jgi:type I restriction enzyme S subunit
VTRFPRVQLRHLSELPIVNGLGLSGSNDNPEWPRYIRTTDIASPTRLRDDVFASQPPAVASSAMVSHGDILMTAAGASIGKSTRFLESYPACFAGFLVRLRPRTNDSGRYLGYWMQSQDYWDQVAVGAVKSTIENFSASRYRALSVPLPPPEEQRAIADFLDQETARIDALVAKQEELIELLRERRSELIADSVTGHNSGEALEENVSWLGSPPAGWKLGQVKHFGVVTLGKMLQSNDTGTDVLAPYMRAANVQPDGVLSLEDVKSMWFKPRELRVLDLRAGDVVVVEGGIGGYGRAGFIAESLVGWGFQNSINRIRPLANYDGRYLTYFLLMARQKGFIKVYCNIVSMPHLTAEKLEAMPMFVPPPDEQRRIADQLDEQTSRIDTLIAKAQEHIVLAKERRSALITAAVTGELDVRTARKAG